MPYPFPLGLSSCPVGEFWVSPGPLCLLWEVSIWPLGLPHHSVRLKDSLSDTESCPELALIICVPDTPACRICGTLVTQRLSSSTLFESFPHLVIQSWGSLFLHPHCSHSPCGSSVHAPFSLQLELIFPHPPTPTKDNLSRVFLKCFTRIDLESPTSSYTSWGPGLLLCLLQYLAWC